MVYRKDCQANTYRVLFPFNTAFKRNARDYIWMNDGKRSAYPEKRIVRGKGLLRCSRYVISSWWGDRGWPSFVRLFRGRTIMASSLRPYAEGITVPFPPPPPPSQGHKPTCSLITRLWWIRRGAATSRSSRDGIDVSTIYRGDATKSGSNIP